MGNIQAVVNQQAALIQCNFEQVEKAIQEKLAEYKGAVFTEDSRQTAKKEVAGLRAQKKAFQDNLREEKKKYMAPWDAFESQAKRLIAMYDEPIDLISGQIQAFEEKRIAEKRSLITSIYQELVTDLQEYIPLDRIYDQKWENATVKEKDIRKDISAVAESAGQAIITIRNMKSEAVESALEMYKRNLSLTEALAYVNDYERRKQEILAREQERQKREEEERIRREERERILAEQRICQAEEAARKAREEKAAAVEQAREEAAQEVVESLIPSFDGAESTYEYTLELTADAKEKLDMYLDSVGITWHCVEIRGF